MTLNKYNKDDVIINPQDQCQAMYVVMSGVVEVFVKQGKENLTLETLGVGSIIG